MPTAPATDLAAPSPNSIPTKSSTASGSDSSTMSITKSMPCHPSAFPPRTGRAVASPFVCPEGADDDSDRNRSDPAVPRRRARRRRLLSLPSRGACSSELSLGDLVLEPVPLDVGVGDVLGEPPRVVPDPRPGERHDGRDKRQPHDERVEEHPGGKAEADRLDG